MFQRTKTWSSTAPTYGRFWVDNPRGERKQKTVTLGPCATRTIARQKLREHIEKAGVNSKEQFYENTSATTFKKQAEKWLEYLRMRTRRPVKPATLAAYGQALNAWLLPNIGHKLLTDVDNETLLELVRKMTAAGRSAKTICNYSQVVKQVLASAKDPKTGRPLHPREWDDEFCQIPLVQKEKQRRPTVTETELEEILASVKEDYRVLFTLLPGTRLRIGEALGLKTSDFSSACRVLHVQRSLWQGTEQEPKTGNAIRIVDIPETLASVLRAYMTGKNGYLFTTRTGEPLCPRNVLRALHATGKRVGFHAFRRFRAAVLRKAQVPDILVGLWLGHARTLTDRYAEQLRDDEVYRGEWCERAGLGFSVGTLLHKNVVLISTARVA